METLKIDKTKLMTVRNFAVMNGITPQQVYNWIKSGRAKEVVIDGVKFIQL